MELALANEISQTVEKTKGLFSESVNKTVTSVSEAAEKATSSLSEITVKTKDTISQTADSAVHNLAQMAAQAKNSLSEVATQTAGVVSQTADTAKTAIAQTAAQAKNSLSEVATQTAGVVSQTADTAKTAISQTAETSKAAIAQTKSFAVDSVNQLTAQATATISDITEKSKASLEDYIQKAETLNRSLSEGIQGAISSYLSDWVSQHPAIYWILTHPLQMLAIICLSLILLWGLLKAMAGSVENFWIFILQLPIKLSRSLFGWGFNSLRPSEKMGFANGHSQENISKSDRSDQLGKILNRLDAIKKEQDSLLQELATLVKSEDVKIQ